MSTNWPDEFLFDEHDVRASVRVFETAGFPPPVHPAEADLFVRQEGVPGHNQGALSGARILAVGAGGLGSWAAVGLARSGARTITVIDPDRCDRTNASRQLVFGRDLWQFKAVAVAENLVGHMIAGGQLTAVPVSFETAAEEFPLPADVVLCLVDNNACRLAVSLFARRRRIPAIFAMLSVDGLRLHVFLQGPGQDDACVHCARPNLEATANAPCASATIAVCMVAAAFAVFFTYRALMGWPPGVTPFNWREADLFGGAPDRVGTVTRRSSCPTCSKSGEAGSSRGAEF